MSWKRKLDNLLSNAAPAELEPLEVRARILDDILDTLVAAAGDGRFALTADRIVVRLLSTDGQRRRALRAALDRTLDSGLRARLEASAIEPPPALTVEIQDAPAPGDSHEYEIEALQSANLTVPQRRRAPAGRPAVRLTPLASPARNSFVLSQERIRVGRERTVADQAGRPLSPNDVYFGDGCSDVSRQHALIRWDPQRKHYRIYDHSAHGTLIVTADGAEVRVPNGRQTPGERLRSGDRIYFGSAAGVLFELLEDHGQTAATTVANRPLPAASDEQPVAEPPGGVTDSPKSV